MALMTLIFISLLQTRSCMAGSNPQSISGLVVDDATGEAIVDFSVQTSTRNFGKSEDVFWNHFMMGSARNPGHFSARSPTSNEMVRIIAPGYVPQILTVQSGTNPPASWLEVRLKHGEALGGVVLDDGGQPVAGARVLLATVDRIFLKDGKFEYDAFRGASTSTDSAGRFSLRGEGGPAQKVVIVSPDGHLIQPAIQSEARREFKIALPKPGTLIVRYDIPGDASEANPELYLVSQKKEMPLWTNVSFGLTLNVPNGGELVVSNLTPGAYNFRRWKKTEDGKQGVESEQRTIVIEAGQVQRVDMIRTNGQRIRGQVVGTGRSLALGGYIYVKSAASTGLPWPQRSRNEQNEFKYPSFDASQFGSDGSFQTGLLEPGSYTVIADVYPPEDRFGGMPHRNNVPDYVAVAKVTVTNEAPPPLNLKLAPAQYVNIDGRGVDDQSSGPIPDFMLETGKIDPDNPGEFVWGGGYMGTMRGAGVSEGQFSIWNQRPGDAVRFMANGYLPQTFSRDEIIASRHTANLEVRMRRGGELHGLVLDHAGRPVAGAKVYLAPLELGYARFGRVMGSGSGETMIKYYAHTFDTTDATGHFAFQGVGTNKTRVIVVSEDGQMVHPVAVSGPGQDLKITLPEPATLVVHYDIPGDVAEADFNLTLHSNEMEMPLWKYATVKATARVTNGGQMVLSNLTAGTYDLSRLRMGGPITGGYSYMMLYGDPAERVESDFHKVVLEPGRSQELQFVRSHGQRIEGQVTGLESITNLNGAYLYVGSATAVGSPLDFKSKLESCYDSVKLGMDGHFQTALLEPGNYTLVAEAYEWGELPERTFADDEPQYGGVRLRPRRLALVAFAKVTVTTNAPSPPVKLELHPRGDPAKTP